LTKRQAFHNRELPPEAHTHDATKLLKIAKLESARDSESDRDHAFRLNWLVVKEWKAESRYEIPGERQANELFNAVANGKHGVLRWLKQQW
jgi:hypothetical protein